MEKGIFLITCYLALILGCVNSAETEAESTSEKTKDDPDMQVLVDNISELAAKVLDIFEPLTAKAQNNSIEDQENTYFVSFLLRDRKNRTLSNDEAVKKRMVVNNNFSGERMGTSQVFMEAGKPPKEPPAHNIQLMNTPLGQIAQQNPFPLPRHQQNMFPPGGMNFG